MDEKQKISVAIRPWSDGDLDLLQQLMGDPGMTAYLGGPETPDKIAARHARYCRLHETGPDRMFAILASPDGTPAGSVGYWEKEWRGQTVWETGWSVLPAFQGQGIGTAATALLVARVRAVGKHRYLHAFPGVENVPSNAVCRKLGFSLLDEYEFEYPPGSWMRCNDWRLDLQIESSPGNRPGPE